MEKIIQNSEDFDVFNLHSLINTHGVVWVEEKIKELSGIKEDASSSVFQIMMSDIDRHVIAFGCNPIGSSTIDPLLVRFSDAESAVDWTPTATNTAGSKRLVDGNFIQTAVRSRGAVLIWTDTALYQMQFIGPPFTFGFNQLGSACGCIGLHAAVDVGGISFFFLPILLTKFLIRQ